MSPSHHIFFDPSGKRKRIARIVLLLSLIAIVTATTLGVVLFLGSPLVSRSQLAAVDAARTGSVLMRSEIPPEAITRSRDTLVKELKQIRAAAGTHRSSAVQGKSHGFIDVLDEAALESVRAHVDSLSTIAPAWLTLDEQLGSISDTLFRDDLNPLNGELRSFAERNELTVLPRLVERVTEIGRARRTRTLLESAPSRERITDDIVHFLQRQALPGIVIDLRTEDARQAGTIATFIHELVAACRAAGKTVEVSVFLDDQLDLSGVASVVDSLIAVNRFRRVDGGQISSLTAFSNRLQAIEKITQPEKIVVALSSAAVRMAGPTSTPHEELSFLAALTQAQAGSIQFDPQSGTSFFESHNLAGDRLRTLLLDSTFSYNTKKLAVEGAVHHFGVWNIGAEDSGVWEVLGDSPSTTELAHLAPQSLSTFGRGDILTPELAGTSEGARRIEVDPQSGLITQVSYLAVPSSATTIHSGYQSKRIALTFDDGPVEPYTTQVLDILKQNDVKATFFVVGEKVLEYPELLARIYSEGHDIGNHSFSHPDLSLVSRNRVVLELNATQRAIQSVLGRSTRLFRPPYISETSPLSPHEFRVLSIARDLGYTTVGISNNGRDWVSYERGQDGAEVERTGEDVANEILAKLEMMQGNSILLHDGPRERERSVEAVSLLIPRLKGMGYSFATVHELMGSPRSEVFPEVSASWLRHMYSSFLTVISYGSDIVSSIFIVVVVLSVLRLALILVCAMLARLEERQSPCTQEDLQAAHDIPVSVIIAAYNEEKVIGQTLTSLLAGNHRAIEIIVVDDGSQDRTAEVVREMFGGDSRVTCVQQANGGKALALNHGIKLARHDILVCLDADTQFDPNAVSYMARHFVNPRVGAVAGNIKVGNRRSILTHWQSMEYITNISIGRRAYSYLNAITVVAGAAGGWRRSAVEACGGYHADSLAEDMDMTWRIRKAGWEIVNEPLSIGYTEAPEDFRSLYKQRFRWSYGALQCIWKHRDALGKHGFFGWFAIPSLFIFGCLFELIAPLADLKMFFTAGSFFTLWMSDRSIYPGSLEYTYVVAPLLTTASLYVLFFVVELMISVLAFRLDKEDMRPLWLLFFQRFVYRQLMYIVACRAVWKAITGWKQGWGTLQRTGTVSLPLRN